MTGEANARRGFAAAVESPRRMAVTITAMTVLAFFFGVVPIWQYVEARVPPAGATVRTATVVDTRHYSGRRSNGGDTGVDFRLPGGDVGSFASDSEWFAPDVGDQVRVYRERGEWRSPAERPLGHLLGGAGALLLYVGSAAGWLRWQVQQRRYQRDGDPKRDLTVARIVSHRERPSLDDGWAGEELRRPGADGDPSRRDEQLPPTHHEE